MASVWTKKRTVKTQTIEQNVAACLSCKKVVDEIKKYKIANSSRLSTAYQTEIRNGTPHQVTGINQARDFSGPHSLHSMEESKIFRTAVPFHLNKLKARTRSCPLCKAAGRPTHPTSWQSASTSLRRIAEQLHTQGTHMTTRSRILKTTM